MQPHRKVYIDCDKFLLQPSCQALIYCIFCAMLIKVDGISSMLNNSVFPFWLPVILSQSDNRTCSRQNSE